MPSQYEDDRTWEAPTAGIFEDDGEDPAEILTECLEKFKTSDYIMEPGIFTQLKRYFQAGGNPEQVIELLSKNYSAVAQKANLLAEWLILGGVKVTEVQAMVENHLKDLILKGFDPKKADTIFTEEGETPGWLTEMIEHPTWRSLIYRLAEEYPDCLMLNFTIKLISDAGFQGEITSISTAAQQIEVFSRVLKTAIAGFLQSGDDWQTNVQECAKMVCHGAHTYVYSQVIVHILAQEPRGGALMKRLAQEITRCAQQNNHDVTPITLALNGAAAWAAARAALASMLSRGALNPADISALFRVYTQPDPPPVHLLRTPQLLELLVDALFKPGSKLNPEHKHKYMYLLAYSASVCEGPGRPVKDELKATLHAIERVHAICCAAPTSTELIAELPTLYHCIRFPVVSVGVVRWVAGVVTEPSYFKLCTEHCPLPLALLDEVAGCHPLLHHQLLQLLVQLFESQQDELEILVQLELRKMLLARMVNLLSRGCVLPVLRYVKQCWQKGDTDISLIRYFITEMLLARMVNLLSRGCVLPVLRYVKQCWQKGDTDISLYVKQCWQKGDTDISLYVKQCWQKGDTDISLIRYFITEVLDAIAPPYTFEFVQLVLPMVENEEITGTMRAEGENDPVSEFIVHCKAHYVLV